MDELLERKVKEYVELYNEWTLNKKTQITIEELHTARGLIASLTIRKYGYSFSKEEGEQEYIYTKKVSD